MAVAHDTAVRVAAPGVRSDRQLRPFQIRLLGKSSGTPAAGWKMFPTAMQREAPGHDTPDRLGTRSGGRAENGVPCTDGAGRGADAWAGRATGPSAAPAASAHIIS